jgi:hypothetical protein
MMRPQSSICAVQWLAVEDTLAKTVTRSKDHNDNVTTTEKGDQEKPAGTPSAWSKANSHRGRNRFTWYSRIAGFSGVKGFAERVIPRLVDQYEMFRGFMMYDPAQLGKTRFKKMLDCFAGKSYEGRDIKNGEVAT